MNFLNPMMQPGMPGGGGLSGQFQRGMMDGSLVGKERLIAGSAVADANNTEAAAKADGIVTPQERMAIRMKKMKARGVLNSLRTNGMGNVSQEALARQQGMGGPGFGGPGFGPGFAGPAMAWGSPAVATPAVGLPALSGGTTNIAMAVSNGGTALARAGNATALARAV